MTKIILLIDAKEEYEKITHTEAIEIVSIIDKIKTSNIENLQNATLNIKCGMNAKDAIESNDIAGSIILPIDRADTVLINGVVMKDRG